MRGCAPSTGGRRGEIRLRNRNYDGRRSIVSTTWPAWCSCPISFIIGQQQTAWECSRRVHWSMASGPWCSCQLRYFHVFSPDVCFPESCHTWPCVYDSGRLLNQQTRIAVTALMVFTHVYSIYTLANTCRPTRAPPVKVRQWPSRLAHIINVLHERQNTNDCRRCEMATGGLCAILLHSTGDYRPNNRICWYNKTNSNTNSNITKFEF